MKDIRRLRRSKGERILLEGPHLVTEALDAELELEAVLMTEDLLATDAGRALAERLERPPLLIDDRLLGSVLDSDSPRGVVALAHGPRRSLDAVPRTPDGVYVYADGLQDPGNLGALARVAEAAGATALVTAPDGCRIDHPRALRASAGSLLRLPLADAGVDELRRHLSPLSPTWATLAPRDGRSIYDPGVPGTLVLVVGAEGPGVSRAALDATDLRWTIPMDGRVESLNATVSAALVLFELRRQRVENAR